MAKKPEQLGLDGVPQPPKRKVIDRIEDKCLERDKLAGKRTAIGDKIAELSDEIQKDIDEEKLEVYTYEDANGVLQDVLNERKLKKRKSKLNPKKKKGDE
jgi:hypothetical protein